MKILSFLSVFLSLPFTFLVYTMSFLLFSYLFVSETLFLPDSTHNHTIPNSISYHCFIITFIFPIIPHPPYLSTYSLACWRKLYDLWSLFQSVWLIFFGYGITITSCFMSYQTPYISSFSPLPICCGSRGIRYLSRVHPQTNNQRVMLIKLQLYLLPVNKINETAYIMNYMPPSLLINLDLRCVWTLISSTQ